MAHLRFGIRAFRQEMRRKDVGSAGGRRALVAGATGGSWGKIVTGGDNARKRRNDPDSDSDSEVEFNRPQINH